MKESQRKVVLITGASSGIGRQCATYLAGKHYTVYGASRNGNTEVEGVEMIKMDVSEDRSVERGIGHILQRENRLDVVVNNAGIGIAGAIESTPIDCARRQFETNFFGILRVCSAVLPQMRTQRSGLIINISSLGGLFGLPFQGLYCASKFALEGMTESMRMEVKRFGIHVTLINPGDFKTNFTRNRQKIEYHKPHSVYQEPFDRALSIVENDEMGGPNPEIIARLVHRIITRRRPKVRYFAGRAYQKAAPYLKKWLPARLVERMLMRYYGL